MIGWPSISSSRVTNCPGLKKNRIGWSAIKQKVRTSQVSWITLTQRTICRPLLQVWVVTGLRKSFVVMDVSPRGRTSALYGADCAYWPARSFICQRHLHAYRDLPRRPWFTASETDVAMSPIDKVSLTSSATLAASRSKRSRANSAFIQAPSAGAERGNDATLRSNHTATFTAVALDDEPLRSYRWTSLPP